MTAFPTVTVTAREQRLGFVYLLLNLAVFPRLLPFCLRLLFPGISEPVQNFCYFLWNFSWLFLLFRRFLWRNVQKLACAWGRAATAAILGLAAYFLLNLAVSAGLQALFPGFSNINDSQVEALFSQNFPLMAIGTVFLVPFAEECLYRGLVFGTLYEKSPAGAYAVSVLLFCGIHVALYTGRYPAWQLTVCAVQYIPAGLCLSLSYRASGNLFVPIAIHAAINAVGILAVR